MKKYTYILSGIFIFFILQSCLEKAPVSQLIEDVGVGGILRNLGATNDLDQSDMTSTYSILLEVQTEDSGKLFKEMNVRVSFNDVDDNGADTIAVSDSKILRTMSASDFNEKGHSSTNGLPVGKFSTTLQQLADHVGISQDEFSHEDQFVIDFEMVLVDGSKYSISNASSDITRTGFFSYFNSQFNYRLTLNAKVMGITNSWMGEDSEGNVKDGRLHAGETDTLFWTINDDGGTKALVADFNVERLSAVGNTDDQIGGVNRVGTNDTTYYYYFVYTPPTVVTDTISFIMSQAALYAGVPMVPDTIKRLFIIDNQIDFEAKGVQAIVNNESGKIERISFDLDFGELLTGGDTLGVTITSSPVDLFDDEEIEIIVESDGQSLFSISFVPLLGEEKISSSSFTMDVLAKGARDFARNEIDLTKSVNVNF